MSATDDGLTMHWMRLEDVFEKTISYAQNYEDILLARVFPEPEGFYIDVGANHPVFHSVTKLFYDRGWSGINIEPSPVVFERLRDDRPRDLNLNVGLSDRDGTLTFHESLVYHGWSTFRPDLAQHYRDLNVAMVERPIPVTTLARVCEAHANRPIDFLKIDAEGFEREVLLGGDFRRWRPRVLLVENSWPEAWEPVMAGLDYRHAAFDGLNRFYVRAEDEALLPAFGTIANVLDNFVPYEYYRLIEDLANRTGARTPPPSLIDAIRRDAPRVARRIRSAVRRLTLRAG